MGAFQHFQVETYYYYYYYYYNCGDLSDAITQNVTGALYTSHCRNGHMSVIQQHS